MSLEAKIVADLKTAMKAKDKKALAGIRAIKSAIMLLKTDGTGNEITAEDEIKLLQKLVKQRKDSLDIYKEQGRDDLAAVEADEIEIIQAYLPAQMSTEEIQSFIEQIITETGAEGMKDMGKVMGVASQKLAGRADGKTVAGIVRSTLQNA